MTIYEALAQIRTLVPEMERSVSIKIEILDYNHYPAASPERRRVEFTVWDERDLYSGSTLEDAVGKCLVANAPDLKEAEAAAVEAGDMAANASVPIAPTPERSADDIPF